MSWRKPIRPSEPHGTFWTGWPRSGCTSESRPTPGRSGNRRWATAPDSGGSRPPGSPRPTWPRRDFEAARQGYRRCPCARSPGSSRPATASRSWSRMPATRRRPYEMARRAVAAAGEDRSREAAAHIHRLVERFAGESDRPRDSVTSPRDGGQARAIDLLVHPLCSRVEQARRDSSDLCRHGPTPLGPDGLPILEERLELFNRDAAVVLARIPTVISTLWRSRSGPRGRNLPWNFLRNLRRGSAGGLGSALGFSFSWAAATSFAAAASAAGFGLALLLLLRLPGPAVPTSTSACPWTCPYRTLALPST